MQQTYSPSELIQALNENRFKGPARQLLGIVKKSERPDHVAFSRQGCGHFVDIPASMIASAEEVGWSNCGDHGHPVVRLQFKEPETAEARTLLSLLLQAQPAAAYAGRSATDIVMTGGGIGYVGPYGDAQYRSAGELVMTGGGVGAPRLQPPYRSATGPGRWLLNSRWQPSAAKDCPAAICDACCCLIFEPNPGGGCLVYFVCWC